MTVKSILVVCQGNICRSPMAEGLIANTLQQHPSIVVDSAGLTALVRQPAEPKAQLVMHNHGIDISAHRAKQLTEDAVRQSELILVMTHRQRLGVEEQFLFAKGKVFLLGHWQNVEIHDPWGHDLNAFETIYQQIVSAWQDWKVKLIC